MFARLSKGLGHKAGGKSALKFRFDVQVDKLENLPSAVKKCRVVWSRGSKLQMTDMKDVKGGVAKFDQTLTMVATLYKDPVEGFEAKEYNFKVQVPGKEGADKMFTVGKADIDMAMYANMDKAYNTKMIPIVFKIGATTTGYLKVVVSAEMVGAGVDEDGMTAVSGLTGLHSLDGSYEEQDLSGFDETPEKEKSRSASPAAKPQASPLTTVRRPGRLAEASASAPQSEIKAVAEEGEEEEEEQEGLGECSSGISARQAASTRSVQPASRGSSRPVSRGVAAKKGDDDDDISEMSLSPEESFTAHTKPGGRSAGAASSTGERTAGSAGGAGAAVRERPPPKVEKYEGELKPLLRDAKAILAGKLSAAMAAARRRGSKDTDESSEPDEGSRGPSTGGKGGSTAASGSRARLSEVLAAAQERQKERELQARRPAGAAPAAAAGAGAVSMTEDEARNALFAVGGAAAGAKSKGASLSRAGSGSSKGAKVAGTPKTEEELRAELFGAPSQKPAAAKTGAGAAMPKDSAKGAIEPPSEAAPAATSATPKGGRESPAPSGGTRRGSLLERSPAPQQAADAKAPLKGAAGARRRPPAAAADEGGGSDSEEPEVAPSKPSAAARRLGVGAAAAGAAAAAAAGGEAAGQLRAENEKLRAQLAVLRDQVAAGDDARRQAKLREERLASERDDYKQQVEELQEQIKEAVAASIKAADAAGLKAQLEELQRQQALHLHDLSNAAGLKAELEELRLQLREAQQQQTLASPGSEAAVAAAATAAAAAQERESRREHCSSLEKELSDARVQLAAANGLLAESHQQLAQASQQQEGQQQVDAEQRIAELERRLADALRQVDESVAMATRAEGQKRELRDQVAALGKRLETLSKTSKTDPADGAPSTPTQPQPAIPSTRGPAATRRDSSSSAASSGSQPGSGDPRKRAAELERQRDGALAALVCEARALLHHGGVNAQINAELAAEVEEVVDGVGLESAGREQMLQAVLALKAGMLALKAGDEAQWGLQEKVKLLRSLVDEASSNQASIRASAVADKEASGQLRAELDRLAQENLQLQHQLTHAKDQATAAEGKLLLRQDRGSEVEAVGEGQQLIRGVHSSSTDGEQSGDAAATTANLQQRLQQADQAFEETAAALETNEREVEKLQLQLAAAAAGAGAAGAAAGAGDAAALRTAVAEVEQLKGVRDKLESMLTDFENEAADEQLRLKGELQLAEGRADNAAQQLEAAQSELVLTKQQLEAALSKLLLVKQQLVEAQAQIAELAADGRGANKQAEEAQGQLVAALKQLAQQERQLREQQAALEAAAVASAATAAAGGHAPIIQQQGENDRSSEAEAAAAALRAQVEKLQSRVTQLEGSCRALERDKVELKQCLADESEDRAALEERVKEQLEEAGDDVAQEAVAGWEAKYNRLKARYRELQEASREECDALHEELSAAHESLTHLEQQVAQLEEFRSVATKGEVTLAETMQQSSRVAGDLNQVRKENEQLMQELVTRKLELAQLSETEVIARRELYKAKELNMKLASKLTKMEAHVYSRR